MGRDTKYPSPPDDRPTFARGTLPPKANGPRIVDRFELIRLLGFGACSEVYAARDRANDRPVALKVGTGPDARREFQVEAWAASRLKHENIVEVLGVGETPEESYLASEYIDGGRSLDRFSNPLSDQQVVRIGIDLAAALAATHDAGLVHRDVKPANAILGRDNSTRLLDFGLARPLAGALPPECGIPDDDGDFICGTPCYIAPELWAGERSTPSSDIYALGAVLFELSAGQSMVRFLDPNLVLEAPFRLLADAVQRRDLPHLSQARHGVDRRLAKIVARSMARKPSRRFPSAAALRAALEECVPPRQRRES